ncbi:MAG: cobyrinate a,c-diamide synthase [Lachnospiraceae bacterium]|nr:cobyrinate a,c-diamide synthase [Lachnospiraceae bacterium]
MNIKRVMIAAPKSGSGKTTVTCALLKTLKNIGCNVVSYKCGPDYIDPMFHEKAIGVTSKNLDTFFTGKTKTRALFINSAAKKDFAVLEGVMGLYDGLGGVWEEGSSYHLAKVTKTPILFVVDAKGMGRSVISLIAGFLAYDSEHLIQGIILNRISKGYYDIIKPLIEEELNIQVIGFLPEREELHIESRHLGLIMPDELEGIKEKLQTVSELFSETVSIESIMEIAKRADVLKEEKSVQELEEAKSAVESEEAKSAGESEEAKSSGELEGSETEGEIKSTVNRPVIAVARDEAFCFYYEDNIRMLEEYGAEIKYFSPLRDEKLPDVCHALLLGGGYPELYAERLSENIKMRIAVKNAVENGMPVVAECGGFMYLHSSMTDKEGKSYDMAGVIPESCFYTGKLVRFGYVELREKKSCFLPEGERIKGHEFHYYDSTGNGMDIVALKPVTGKEYPCIMADNMHWMGFPHLYYPSNEAFAKTFVEKATQYMKGMP